MKLNVVPELSERWTIAILRLGSATPLLSFLIAASFQLVMSPLKILASVGPFMCRRFLTPCTL